MESVYALTCLNKPTNMYLSNPNEWIEWKSNTIIGWISYNYGLVSSNHFHGAAFWRDRTDLQRCGCCKYSTGCTPTSWTGEMKCRADWYESERPFNVFIGQVVKPTVRRSTKSGRRRGTPSTVPLAWRWRDRGHRYLLPNSSLVVLETNDFLGLFPFWGKNNKNRWVRKLVNSISKHKKSSAMNERNDFSGNLASKFNSPL